MAHKLLIDLQDSSNDNKFIHVRDYSIWDPVLEVRDRLFQVLPPYSDQYYIVPIPENSLMSISAAMIGLDVDQELPDGAYNYHYSVSPNKKVFIESCHYRVAGIRNKVLQKMGINSLREDNDFDSRGNLQLSKEQSTLLQIWMLLNSAAAAGRHSHLKARADELYGLAVKDYNKLYKDDSLCTNC